MTTKYKKDYFRLLPYEILENIFSYLMYSSKQDFLPNSDDERSDNTDLKRAFLVCKLWNQVISSSLKLMSTFTLQIIDVSLEALEYPLFIRRYQKIEFYHVHIDRYEDCFYLMSIYGPDLKEITFHGAFLEDYSREISLLRLCPNVEFLRLYDAYNGGKFKKIKHITADEFPNLKRLSIVNRSKYILESFKFVNLECLSVKSRSFLHFPLFIEWKIRKLDVGKIYDVPSFIRFLSNQKPYLRELSVDLNSSILEYIMSEMQDLTKLNLQIDHIPDHMICNNFGESNACLKELTIVYCQLFLKTDFIQMLLRHYSNVESLNLDFCNGGWAFIGEDFSTIKLLNLKHLTVKSSNNFVFLQGYFPKLISLNIESFRRFKIYDFPPIVSLERLTIKYASVNMKISKLAMLYPNLKFISIENGIDLTEKEMKKIITRLPKLQVLMVKRYSWKIAETPKKFLSSLSNVMLNVIFQDC